MKAHLMRWCFPPLLGGRLPCGVGKTGWPMAKGANECSSRSGPGARDPGNLETPKDGGGWMVAELSRR